MQAKTEHTATELLLRYDELLPFAKIIGIEMVELAKPMGFASNNYFYDAKQKEIRLKRKICIELERLDAIKKYVGEEDYATAMQELRLPAEDREDPRKTARITWKEAEQILKLSGIKGKRLAEALKVSGTTVYRYFKWYSRRLVPLRDFHAFKKLVGEANFNRALGIVRKH